MPATDHYHFHLTEDDSEDFVNWRTALNGTEDSALQKIDALLYERGRVIISAKQPEGLTENDTWLEEVG